MRICMLKRDVRLFMRCLLPAAALALVFALVCVAATFVGVKNAQAVYTPVKTAVVDQENSLYSRLVVSAVAQMEDISSLMDISVQDQEDAMAGLASGDLTAVIILPEGMLEGILTGTPTKGTIYLSEAAAAHADVVASTAAFGELMLAAGQYGIFSGEQLIWQMGMEEQFHRDFLDRYNAKLLAEAFGAESRYFDLQVTDYADTNMTTAAYYGLCWLTLLLLLTPMFFSRLYSQDLQKPILCRLRGMGISDGVFLVGKVMFPFFFGLVLMAAAWIAAGKFMELSFGLGEVLASVVGVLLAAVLGGFTVMASQRGVPVAAAGSVAGLLLCGGMIPRQLLPEWVLTFGDLTPYGAVLGVLKPVFGAKWECLPVIGALCYALLLTALVCRRLKDIRVGGETP